MLVNIKFVYVIKTLTRLLWSSRPFHVGDRNHAVRRRLSHSGVGLHEDEHIYHSEEDHNHINQLLSLRKLNCNNKPP